MQLFEHNEPWNGDTIRVKHLWWLSLLIASIAGAFGIALGIAVNASTAQNDNLTLENGTLFQLDTTDPSRVVFITLPRSTPEGTIVSYTKYSELESPGTSAQVHAPTGPKWVEIESTFPRIQIDCRHPGVIAKASREGTGWLDLPAPGHWACSISNPPANHTWRVVFSNIPAPTSTPTPQPTEESE